MRFECVLYFDRMRFLMRCDDRLMPVKIRENIGGKQGFQFCKSIYS